METKTEAAVVETCMLCKRGVPRTDYQSSGAVGHIVTYTSGLGTASSFIPCMRLDYELAIGPWHQDPEERVDFIFNGLKLKGKSLLTYEEATRRAGKEGALATVCYHGAAPPKPDGMLAPGESVRLTYGSVVNVDITGSA